MKNWVIKKRPIAPARWQGLRFFYSGWMLRKLWSSTTIVAVSGVGVAVREVVLGTFPYLALLALLLLCVGTTFVTLSHFSEVTCSFAEVLPLPRVFLASFLQNTLVCDHLLAHTETILLPLLAKAQPHLDYDSSASALRLRTLLTHSSGV